jgi:uncharacterized protein (TIGR02757 family)
MKRHPSSPLALALDELERRYRCDAALEMDPLQVALQYAEPMDQEVAAWVAAHLAYGRVAPMLAAIRKALTPLGAHPAILLRKKDATTLRRLLDKKLPDWVWRFHTREDLLQWLLTWKQLDAESQGKGLEPHLCPTSTEDADMRLSALVQRLRRELPATHGIRFLLPDPLEGAACKRWRLFLRWMVRQAWPDLGIWKTYPMSALVIPLDTHVARISGFLALTNRRTANALQAQEITSGLKTLHPEDPLRYDFALAHLGIMGDCPSKPRMEHCASCPLAPHCREGLRIKSTS